MKAIAAMALNGVIGNNGQIPWHIPDDFRWFKRMTLGQVVVMGRKTWDSLGRPLPGRLNVVLTRHPPVTGAETITSLDQLDERSYGSREIFIAGGAEVYAQTLGRCTDLYLSVVFQEPEGDVFFPPFAEMFELQEVVLHHPAFEVRRYRNVRLL